MAKAKGRTGKRAQRVSRGQKRAAPRKRSGPAGERKNAKPADVDSAVDTLGVVPDFPVVGIGASAGGLEACSQILESLPADSGIAVIIVQHLAPSHESVLPELLSGSSKMPVVQVTDGMEIRRDHVYVIPPNRQMGILNGRLRLMPRPGDRSQHKPVDFFLRSLAVYGQSRAIAVILSGTDSDGSVGLRDVKGIGGITIAQEPKTAKFDGMPRSAIATNMVDLVLPPHEIAQELVRIAQHPLVRTPTPIGPDSFDEQLQKIFLMLRKATGVDFTHYKLPTIRRRLQRRMVLHKVTGVDQYVKHLQQNPGEVRALYQDILIHVTRFFRDPETFETLRTTVYPKIVQGHDTSRPVRIWVPGCSTGEEAYSIAISLLEHLGDDANTVGVQIFATDVSEEAIEHARSGIYPESISADVSPDLLRRFFNKSDGNYRVSKPVRDMCIFARQDLTRDPPFSKIDLIVCRNVLIYLGPVLQRRLMNVFHYALKPEGFLMLGGAETIGPHADLFAVSDKRHRLYSKRIMAMRAEMEFPPVDFVAGRERADRKTVADPRGSGNIQNEANRIILARYSPPGVIVDSENQIVQFRGQTGAFLEPAPGEASLNVLKMAREGLLYGLRTALYDARKNNSPVRREGLRVKRNGHILDVNLEIVPLSGAGGNGGRHYLILFEDVTSQMEHAPPPAKQRKGKVIKGNEDHRVSRLQEELAANREYLQSIIQDLEAANEELQSANEEILSSNGELQSTNEELDTAKEELQSTNEELNTVNEELQGRNEELSRVNSDLVNLLGSVQIAIVMVASDLRIRRFTPMAEKVLNLIPSDVGRPISDIKPNIDCPDLEQLITECVERVATKEREVRDRTGNWFSLRIRPYKNIENRIDGAVLALFDVDASRRQETHAREAREYADALMETVHEPLVVLDEQLLVQRANHAFYQMASRSSGEVENRSLIELLDGRFDVSDLRAKLESLAADGGSVNQVEIRNREAGADGRMLRLNARVIPPSANRTRLLLLAIDSLPPAGQ
ncbi:MAG TPA: chemotaxis protein CheB [Tepidisphaeraceae bacterium]|nr:chemotaxis protein CheB [Tepidisphaeraceae bacterium]